MRYRIISILVLVLWFVLAIAPPTSGAQEATPQADCPATTEDENKAMALRWHEDAISGHDPAVIDEIAAEDIIHHAGSFPDGVGPDAVKRALGALLAGFPDLRQTVEDVIAEDDKVVTRWTTEGTHEGEFQGFQPTGKRVSWAGINIFRFECGKIAEEWTELDGVGRLAQIEAAATPAP